MIYSGEKKDQLHVSKVEVERDILDKAVETGKALIKAELDRSTTAFMTLLFGRFNVTSLKEREQAIRKSGKSRFVSTTMQ